MTLAFFRARAGRALMQSCLLGVVASLASCGGTDVVVYGTGVITLQSTNIDFVSYRINIDSITLTRSDGIVVEPLLYPQTVDLAQTVDVAELVGAPAIPIGTYLSATITFDYTEPSIWVQKDGTESELLPVAVDGTEMTETAITVTFDPNQPLVINSQESTRIAINIDLSAFNTVNTTAGEVAAQPVAVIRPAPVDATPLRARGLYVTQMTVDNGFIMNARPFIDQVSAIGAEIINTSPQAYWNINGLVFTGNSGLTELAQAQVSTPIIAYGTLGNLSGITPTFNATQVYVGTVAQDPLAQDVFGVVSERSGNTLIIRGGTYFDIYLTDVISVPSIYFGTATVAIGPDTVVLQDGNASAALSINSISVGQLVHVYGSSTVSPDLTTLTMDATAGLIRLLPTPVWGTLNSASSNSASVVVQRIGEFTPEGFDFTGTGAAAGQDADPTNYVVNTGSTNLSGTATDTLLRFDGLVTPFASAPPDFTATTVTTSLPQQLVIVWGANGSTKPFTLLQPEGIVVDKTNTSMRLYNGPAGVDLTTSPIITMPSAPQLQLTVGVATEAGLLTTETVSATAAEYISQMNAAVNGTNTAWRLIAIGSYNSATNTFAATSVEMNFL
jgi:hypothetical protein